MGCSVIKFLLEYTKVLAKGISRLHGWYCMLVPLPGREASSGSNEADVSISVSFQLRIISRAWVSAE